MNGSCIGKMNDYFFFCNFEYSYSLIYYMNIEIGIFCCRKDSCINDYSRV